MLRAPDGYRKVIYRDENRPDEVSLREKEKMSLTEKTDTRDSDEKVVEFLPDCNKFLHMILIIFSGKAFYNIINFQRIFFVMIYDNGHFLCRFFCLSCLF